MREAGWIGMMALVFLALLAGAGAAGQFRVTDEEVSVAVRVKDPAARIYVGEPVSVIVTVTNKTTRALVIPDWETCPQALRLCPSGTGIPGAAGDIQNTSLDLPGFTAEGQRSLQPGKVDIERQTVIMIPGRYVIKADFYSPDHTFPEEVGGRYWYGRLFARLTAEAPAEMSPGMKARYGQLQQRLLGSTRPEDQLKIINDVAAEKHYFAARFIREVCDAPPLSAVRDTALSQLVELAKFGTAYESFDFLLGKLADDATAIEVRTSLLEWVGTLLERKGRHWLASQVIYIYPESLMTQAREVVGRLANGRAPNLATQAREILKKLDAAKKAGPESATPPAKTAP